MSKRFCPIVEDDKTPAIRRPRPRVASEPLPTETETQSPVRFRSRRRLDVDFDNLNQIRRATSEMASDSVNHASIDVDSTAHSAVVRPLSPAPEFISLAHLSPLPFDGVDELTGEGIRHVQAPSPINENTVDVATQEPHDCPPPSDSSSESSEWPPKSPLAGMPYATVVRLASEWGLTREPLATPATGWGVRSCAQTCAQPIVLEEPEFEVAPEISDEEWAAMFGKR